MHVMSMWRPSWQQMFYDLPDIPLGPKKNVGLTQNKGPWQSLNLSYKVVPRNIILA